MRVSAHLRDLLGSIKLIVPVANLALEYDSYAHNWTDRKSPDVSPTEG